MFKAKYLDDKESRYKLICKNFNLKKIIANGILGKITLNIHLLHQ